MYKSNENRRIKTVCDWTRKIRIKTCIPAEVFVKKKNHDFQLPSFLEM